MKNTITVIMQSETVKALAKVPAATVSAQASRLGLYEGEPVLVIADALLSYAKAYKARFECNLSDDGFISEPFTAMLSGVKEMLNMGGAVAMRRGITTDSKDNGALFDIIEATCKASGIDYQNL